MEKKFILIAEDEPAYAKLLKNGLQKAGYEVMIACNGDELLKIVRKKRPDLIVLDLLMPVKNGFEVMEEMKKDEKLKKIKVIALSNLGQEEDILNAKKLGAADFLIKSDETYPNTMRKIEQYLL